MWHHGDFQRNRFILTNQIKTKMQHTKWSVQIKEGLLTKTQRFVPAYIPRENTTNMKNSGIKEDFTQYEFIMHFMVPMEFSMSAKSPRAILIKYVLIVHSALVSFLPFLIKHCYCFRLKFSRLGCAEGSITVCKGTHGV